MFFFSLSKTSDCFKLVLFPETCFLGRIELASFLPMHKIEAMFVCGCGTNKESSNQLVILFFTEFQLAFIEFRGNTGVDGIVCFWWAT